jgi:hypothetical protein
MSYNVLNVIKDLIHGELEFADTETAVNRITICNTCEVLNTLRQCTACSCFVDAKTKLNKSECPLGFW